jgi:transcriptional regulator with XRE-family HTH domain
MLQKAPVNGDIPIVRRSQSVSQTKIEGKFAGLSQAIRHTRFRLGMNMTDFGRLLGVTHGQVSRYESGRAGPGYLHMGRLLQLAEGAEKNPIIERLAEMLDLPARKASEVAMLSELEKMGHYIQPLWNDLPLHPPPTDPGVHDEFREFTPNLAELLKVVSELCHRRREVDESLVRILRLWLTSDDADGDVRRRFADAAKFIEVGLAASGSEVPIAPTVSRQNRRM